MHPIQDLEKTISSELDTLSHEELTACARLLALSVAEHRAKFGIVPLETSTKNLWQGQAKGSRSLPREAKSALSEAMTLVRRRAQSLNGSDTTPATAAERARHNKRRQLRISVSAPIQVAALDSTSIQTATLRDISWGGAAIFAPNLNLSGADQVQLLLPARGTKIAILATVLRHTAFTNGAEYALRFESLSTEDEDRLQQVLELLLDDPQSDGRRSQARLVQRLDVEYGDAGEFNAAIEDISSNGLTLTVLEPLEINQSLALSLSSADTPLHLSLRARVVNQTAQTEGGLTMYRVGLQFEHPTEQLRQRLDAVMRQLALLRPSFLEERATNSLDEDLVETPAPIAPAETSLQPSVDFIPDSGAFNR